MHTARLIAATLALFCSLGPAAAEPEDFVSGRKPLLASEPAQARMRERIRAFEAGDKAGLQDMMRVVRDDGQPFYLVQSLCCDQFNPLYDAQGRYVCAPSGGFGGHGDGRCPAWARDLRLRLSLPQASPEPIKSKTASVY